MKMLLGVIIVVLIVVALVWLAGIIQAALSSRRGVDRTGYRRALHERGKMEALLSRIASNSVGDARLEAELLLEEINRERIKELEK